MLRILVVLSLCCFTHHASAQSLSVALQGEHAKKIYDSLKTTEISHRDSSYKGADVYIFRGVIDSTYQEYNIARIYDGFSKPRWRKTEINELANDQANGEAGGLYRLIQSLVLGFNYNADGLWSRTSFLCRKQADDYRCTVERPVFNFSMPKKIADPTPTFSQVRLGGELAANLYSYLKVTERSDSQVTRKEAVAKCSALADRWKCEVRDALSDPANQVIEAESIVGRDTGIPFSASALYSALSGIRVKTMVDGYKSYLLRESHIVCEKTSQAVTCQLDDLMQL